MESQTNDRSPVFSHVEPVLAVKNVKESIAYWQEILGFTDKWIWDPPTLGGVSWNGAAFIQFSEEPELAAASAGNSLWIPLRNNVDTLYALHQKNGVTIVEPLKFRSWGYDQYTIRDMNGYYIHFAARGTPHTPEPLPAPYRVVLRMPTDLEHAKLARAVGWLKEGAEFKYHPAVFQIAAVAEDATTGEVVGCAYLVGDNQSIYYMREVMVLPAWQRHGIGTAVVQALVDWLKTNASPKAIVGLFTGEHLGPFYRQFGFVQACGMYREVGEL
jgi:GNAT superfamily N-acetyltransferase